MRRAKRLGERYAEDSGGYLSAAIAYYAFLSVFPLLLLGLSIVGFALAHNPSLRDEISRELARSVPGIETLLGRNLTAFEEARVGAGIIGLAGLLWTGTGVVGAGRNAVLRVFRQATPKGGLGDKLWLVGVTAGLGVVALASTGLATVAGGLDSEGPAGVVVAFGLDLGLFLVTYRLLMRRMTSWGDLFPGALFAAAAWTLLKLLGTWYATTTVERAETVYGTFAATVGVLVLLYLAARVFVYGAELNAVLLEEGGGGSMRDRRGNGERSTPGRDADPHDVSTMRLVGQVAGDVGTLVKKEVELARQEITEGIAARAMAAAAFGGAAVMMLFVLGFLGAAAAAALDQVMATWAALLIVAGAFILLAVVAGLFGLSRLRKPPIAPVRAKKSIKEDVEWAKAQLRR